MRKALNFINYGLLIIALGAIMVVLREYDFGSSTGFAEPKTLAATGFIVLAAFAMGEFFKLLNIPALLGYIVAGIVFGPNFFSALNAWGVIADVPEALFSKDVIADLPIVIVLTVGVIGTMGGGELVLEDIKKNLKTILFCVAIFTLLVVPATIVTVLILADYAPTVLPFLEGLDTNHTYAVALLFGVFGIAMSPAATLAILQETKASGRFTSLALGVVIVADLVLVAGFLAAVALSILAYKGFTTITNSGDEVEDPEKNVGRSIIISLLICTLLYVLVTLAVAGNLSIGEIVAARDSSLAEAARPAVGQWGEWLTIALAIVATISGVIASMFAVSRMLAMLTDMDLVPHRHFGMPGRVQKHTLVYTTVLAVLLTVFFDLSRIASLGAIFYIVMDMAIHWGVYRHLRQDVGARAWVVLTALVLDAVVLGAFAVVKAESDPTVLVVSAAGLALVFGSEWWFIRRATSEVLAKAEDG